MDFKFSYTKNLPKLTSGQTKMTLPLDQPYQPFGRMTETHTAIEIVKKELPNTKKRLMRSTYRNFLVIEKRNRDSEDFLRQINQKNNTDV